MFNERKAAQMAAYFLHRAGGAMPHLKLMKLMYLADRHHYRDRGLPISDDDVVAMRFGPVLSRTLDLINGNVRPSADWGGLISDRGNHEAALRRPIAENDFDELSRAEAQTLGAVFDRFGHYDKWDLSDYTHTLGEWSDPGDGSTPISPKDILTALGKSRDEIETSLQYIAEGRELSFALASLGVRDTAPLAQP